MVRSIRFRPRLLPVGQHDRGESRRLDDHSVDLVNVEHLTVEEVRQVAGLTIQA